MRNALKWIIAIGVIAMVLGLSMPTYERIDQALEEVAISADIVKDDFQTIGLMIQVIELRFSTDPAEEGYSITKDERFDGSYVLTLYYFDENQDETNFPAWIKTYEYSSEVQRDDAWNIISWLFAVPTWNVEIPVFEQAIDAINNILFILATAFAILVFLVFVLIDIAGIAIQLIKACLIVIGFNL